MTADTKKEPYPFFHAQTCSAPAARSDYMRDIVLAHAPRDRRITLLDVGCGTGSLLFRLADALPAAELTGLDVSPANIKAAEAQRAGHPAAARLRFEAADYLEYVAPAPFDAIVTDGVLHLIPGDTTSLLRKLANDVAPGGVLVCGMPYECAYNRAFSVVRRGLRVARSPWLDEMILRVGRLLHGSEMTDAGLRERIPYMYIPPARMVNPAFTASAASTDLALVARYRMPSASLSQLRHCVIVFERAGGATR
jgi:SAM-dependent methyltransferase